MLSKGHIFLGFNAIGFEELIWYALESIEFRKRKISPGWSSTGLRFWAKKVI